MATTKQVLRLQSDQILDDPQVGSQVRLKDLTATRAINLVWTEPAAADWNVEFKDPGANDAVVYENLAQTLNNKTLPSPTITDFTNANHDHSDVANGGQVSHTDLSDLATGDPHTQYAALAGRAGGQTLIGGSAASEDLSLQSTSDVTRGDIIAIDDIQMGSGKEVVGLPATPSGPTAAASKAYVDSAVAGGASWKEVLLTADQLDSVNDGIAPAISFFLTATAQIGDGFSITDGGSADSWVFAGVSAPNQPAVGASALDSMTDLVNRINIDSATWAASLFTGVLQGINSPSGDVVVIYRRVPTSTVTDRIYGPFAAPTTAQIVDFGGEQDYRSSVNVQLPTGDPLTANFGFGRLTAELTPNEAHLVRAEDSAYIWNEDAGTWQLSAGAVSLATSGPGGGTVGQSTYDEDFGLEVVGGGLARVRVDGSTIVFSAGQLAVSGGAVPLATSGPGGATEGKVTADSNLGLEITGGPTNAILATKVDGVSITHDLSGALSATGAPLAPTGNVSQGVLITRDIPGVVAPSPSFISTDIPVQDYIDGITTGQLFDFVVPADYDGGDIEILASYQMTTALVGSVYLETSAKIVRASTGAVDTGTFPAVNAVLNVPGTTDLTRDVIKQLPNPSGANFQRGDTIQFYVKRLGADGSDTHTGDWRVTAFAYRYQGQINTRLMEPVVDIFTPVSGTPSPAPGFFATDIPIINYSDTVDQASAARFVVPDNWDGTSDAVFRLQYALDAAVSGTVRLNTVVRIADVSGGSVVVLSGSDFDKAVTADTDPHRTEIIRSVPGTNLSPGSVVQLITTRDTAVGGNPAAGFQVINATLAFGIAPVSGVSSRLEYYLDDPVFGNLAGTVFADRVYPAFGGDFDYFYEMRSTAAAGAVHAAFIGRLSSSQTSIDQIVVSVKGIDTGTCQYSIKVYAEGSGGTPVYTQAAATPPASITQDVIPGTALSAQPTGSKRFFVVVEATAMENTEAVSISKPFIKVS